MAYDVFLEENIFKPPGMNHTFVNDGKKHNRAIGYNESQQTMFKPTILKMDIS
jgi:CubicO group peptidase (beta-lactamase class C family)